MVGRLLLYFYENLVKAKYFANVKVVKLSDIRENYYFDTLSEISFNENDNNMKIYNKYMSAIDIKDIYKDSIASIITNDKYLIVRVKHFEDNLISKKQFTNLYTMKLLENGFVEKGSNDYRRNFRKDNINIEIMYETGYVVFLYSEVDL